MEIVQEYEAGDIYSWESDAQKALSYAKEIMKNGNNIFGVILQPRRVVIYDDKGAVCEEILPDDSMMYA